MIMNEQGLWNDNNSPAWHSDYHTDINVEMNYWPTEVTNLGECHLPLFNLIVSQIPFWRLRTKESMDLLTPEGKHSSKGFATTAHNIFGGKQCHLLDTNRQISIKKKFGDTSE